MKVKLQDLLKQGIEDGDWSIICSLYKSITGEQIEVPKTPKRKNLFIDDGRVVRRETADEKKLYNDVSLDNKRQPVQYIKVNCGCGQIDELPDYIAGPYLRRGDDAPEYKCQRCILRHKRSLQ
jgi:hypothetical protein